MAPPPLLPRPHAQPHWLSRITFIEPLAGKFYMGEDALVERSREHVFRNHRFLLFPRLFIPVSCQACTQANGKADKIFQCPSRPHNPGPLERIILNIYVDLNSRLSCTNSVDSQGLIPATLHRSSLMSVFSLMTLLVPPGAPLTLPSPQRPLSGPLNSSSTTHCG